MIKKGRKYTCVKEFTGEVAGKKITFFKECKYTSTKDDTLLWFDNTANSAQVAVEVIITPDVADMCFQEDCINHPSHYNTNNPKIYIETDNGLKEIAIECIDVIRNMPLWKGNIIKYAWRAGLKEEAGKSIIDKEIEDLEKIKAYANDRIKQLELEKKIQ